MNDRSHETEHGRESSLQASSTDRSGDVKSVSTELLAEFVKGLTTEVFQKSLLSLEDVLCQGEYADAFNSFPTRELKSPLHMICVGFALFQEGKKAKGP